ncbi:MAG: hypothetical protein J6Z46_10285, partial [Lachnospiraceae bacterium]|nr:hypothetical protein [Lachnospiraceae bacterium]
MKCIITFVLVIAMVMGVMPMPGMTMVARAESVTLYEKWTPKTAITPVVSITDWTYGSTANAPTVAAESNPGSGEVTYEYYTDGTCETKTSTLNSGAESEGAVPKKSGNYYVKAYVAETDDYQSGTGLAEFTISPKGVTVSGVTAENKDYDGTTDATISGTATVSGKVENDDVTVTMGTATFADALPGEEKAVSFSGFSLGGTDAGNYTLSAQPASVTAEIRKATIAPVVSITGWTYGDEAKAPAVTGGNPGNGAVSFAYYTDA